MIGSAASRKPLAVDREAPGGCAATASSEWLPAKPRSGLRKLAAHSEERDGYIFYGQKAHPQELRARPRGHADAEPDRGSEELVRSFSANGYGSRTTRQCRAAGSAEIGIPDPRLFGAGPARIRALRARGPEIRCR